MSASQLGSRKETRSQMHRHQATTEKYTIADRESSAIFVHVAIVCNPTVARNDATASACLLEHLDRAVCRLLFAMLLYIPLKRMPANWDLGWHCRPPHISALVHGRAVVRVTKRTDPRGTLALPTDVRSHGSECAEEHGSKLILARRAGFATLMASCTCPVFRPSLEEFRDFQAYLGRIEPHAWASGICKIIPPEGWWQTPREVEQICRVDGTMYALCVAPTAGTVLPLSPQETLVNATLRTLLSKRWLGRKGFSRCVYWYWLCP